jgi:NADPH-dependent 2,4-dienoyl-CoA reductase/sulfur reductase-like enzyme
MHPAGNPEPGWRVPRPGTPKPPEPPAHRPDGECESEFVMDSYDLVVIGSGPAGQKAAIAAAKLGYRAALVDRGHMMGGVCINTGTIPSKTPREAVPYLTGLSQRELYGRTG